MIKSCPWCPVYGHLWWWEQGGPSGLMPSLGTRQTSGPKQVLAV